MANYPRVSLLIPCFNGSGFIERAFKSILSQSEDRLEVIFVNDGSTDKSLVLAQSYKEIFEKKGYVLRIFNKQNGGAASAIKLAIQHAYCKYVMLMDIDDELYPDSVKKQADFLDCNADCGLVFANGISVTDETGEVYPIRKNKEILNRTNVFKGLLLGTINNVPGMYMVRNQKLQEYYKTHSFLITQYGQNLQVLLPVAFDSYAGYIDEPLIVYHRHVGSHSNPGSYEKVIENLKGYRKIRYDILREMGCFDADILKLPQLAFLTAILLVDASFGKVTQYNNHYEAIQRLRSITDQEKMEYYILNKSIKQYYYRLKLKLKKKI